MEINDPLYREFLTELDALERFRTAYAGMRPAAGLVGDDPDVRRLIEALALFSARTRRASSRAIDQGMLRMFRQHFSYLCDPMPAMSLLQASVGGRCADAAHVPSGARALAAVAPAEGVRSGLLDAPPVAASFRTTARLRILPLRLNAVEILPRTGGGFRMVFDFESDFFRNDELGELSLFVNYLDDFLASLQVLDALKVHLRGAGVVFEDVIESDSRGEPVEVGFGAPASFAGEPSGLDHPVQRVRSVFHFPQQALYLNLRIPKQPRNWQSFGVYLDLAADFPRAFRLTPDVFCMHVVPMVNLERSHTDVVLEDGTRDRHLLRHPDAASRFVLHSVRGAYEIGADSLEPLTPGVLEDADRSYEVEVEREGQHRLGFVRAHFEAAFDEPKKLTLDAFWHQPALCDDRLVGAAVGLLDRTCEGISFTLLGQPVRAADNHAVSDRQSLLQLLSIKNQRFLELGNLTLLLRAVGAGTQPYFEALLEALTAVRVEAKPYGRGSRGFKYIYYIEYQGLEHRQLPALDLFSRTMLELLIIWSIEEIVELRVHVPNLELERCYP